MSKCLPILIMTLSQSFLFAQTDDVGSGRAIQFDGVDDYIDLGNVYDDLQLPFTVSAWVYVEQSSAYIYPILTSQDNAPLYNGFWFCVSSTNLFVEYGDGRGENNDAYRKGKSAPVSNLKNRWIYVSAVFKSATDIQLYANGSNVGGAYTGSSSHPMASNFPNDVAKVGYFLTNSVVHRFKGIMDELRIWNRALTEDEIRQTMCQKLKGNEPGLIGYWPFDETEGSVLNDLSSNGFHGQLKGDPTRVFSGAPVGDESVFLYTTSWMGKSLSKDDLSVGNVSGSPYGIHIYEVNDLPSQTGGLNPGSFSPPYYGVFLASDDTGNKFDLTFTEGRVCQLSERNDNSVAFWNKTENLNGFSDRIELIPYIESGALQVDLGPDIFVCNDQPKLLQGGNALPGRAFLWNTGHTTSSISVSSSGAFWVEVRETCWVGRDTVQVLFQGVPPAFFFGEDEISCRMEPRTLTTSFSDEDYEFEWQDGSKENSFNVAAFGTYWLKLQNSCGSSVDSITFSQKVMKDFVHYNFMSPDNSDNLNQYFMVDDRLIGCQLTVFNRWGRQVYHATNYQNQWDGQGLNVGIYYYTLKGDCFEDQKGTVTITQ